MRGRGRGRNSGLADLCRAPFRVAELLTALCLAPLLDREGRAADPSQEWFFREAERLKADLSLLFSAGSRAEVVAFLGHLDANRDEYRRSFLLWLEVVEELCLEAELDLRDNTGAVKMRRVKAGMFYLLDRFTEGADVVGIPRYLDRLVVHLMIRATVEFVVSLVNVEQFEEQPLAGVTAGERGLWTNVIPKRRGQAPRRRPLSRRLVVPVVKAWESLWAWLLDRIVAWLLGPPWTVSPQMKRRVDNLVARYQTGSVGDPPIRGLVNWVFDVLRWVGTHGREVRAAINALTVAIHLTAEIADLSREERIALVEEALVRVFKDMGIGGPYFRVVLRIAVDVALDAIVHLFQKRGVLTAR